MVWGRIKTSCLYQMWKTNYKEVSVKFPSQKLPQTSHLNSYDQNISHAHPVENPQEQSTGHLTGLVTFVWLSAPTTGDKP